MRNDQDIDRIDVPMKHGSGTEARTEDLMGDSVKLSRSVEEQGQQDADLLTGIAHSTQVEISIGVEPDGRVQISVAPYKGRDGSSGSGTYSFSMNSGTRARFILVPPGDLHRERKQNWRYVFRQTVSSLREKLHSWPYGLDITLFTMALALYFGTRLVGLSSFPIYFFSDEAVQTMLAADLLRENFHNAEGEFLPTYFYNVDKYSLSTTVYLHLLPYLMFGKSVFASRLTSVLVSLLAAVSVGMILRNVFRLPYWWSGTLLLSIMPAWFLHSRTAFETVTMVSFYATGLYFYLCYRQGKPRALYAAIILFALAFYSYNPGQVVVMVTGLLFLVSDARYHWQQRNVVLRGLGILVLLALPYLRFWLDHPDAFYNHLSSLDSYWVKPLSLEQKLAQFRGEYLYGLSPGYWFVPNGRDLMRHTMKGYGNLLSAALPFAALGTFQALRNFRTSAYRAVLICFVAAPAGAAIVQVAVTRALAMVVPATLLTALGVIMVLTWLEKHLPRSALSVGLFGLLAIINLHMTWHALRNGPTWYQDYGLMGMQYGAAQVFAAVKDYQSDHPDTEILFSPTWANGADMLARFFLYDPLPVRLASITAHISHRQPLDENMLFVMPVDEYTLMVESGKFTNIQVDHTVPFPNGKPGFYFVRPQYVENIDEILAAEQASRRELREADVVIDGKLAHVRHTLLDMGDVSNLWDGNQRSVTRTFEANPYQIEITFSETSSLRGLMLNVGDTEVNILAHLYTAPEADAIEYRFEGLRGSVTDPQVSVDFGVILPVHKLYLEVKDLHQNEPAHVHLWEIIFLGGVQ